MEDKTLKAHLLAPEFVIKNFIQGEPDCDYEKYMLEFINESTFFQLKADGGEYIAPPSEESGQCDCISDKYQLDFKLIASKTILQARSILSAGKTVITKGVVITGLPKVSGKTMKGTRIHAALRDYSFDMLCELPIDCVKIDQSFILNILKKNNNQVIVDTTLQCTRRLGLDVCLEGVENQEIKDFVGQYSANYHQGYYYSRPVEFDAFMEFIHQTWTVDRIKFLYKK